MYVCDIHTGIKMVQRERGERKNEKECHAKWTKEPTFQTFNALNKASSSNTEMAVTNKNQIIHLAGYRAVTISNQSLTCFVKKYTIHRTIFDMYIFSIYFW